MLDTQQVTRATDFLPTSHLYCGKKYHYYYISVMAFFQDNLGKPALPK